MSAPSQDLDDLENSEILDLFQRVKANWAPRDELIRKAVELREQSWNVAVPKAWKQTATQHHTSRSKEIPERVKGTIMLNSPNYSRSNPGEDFGVGEDQNQVERWHKANFDYWDGETLEDRSGREFLLDNLVSKGGACAGTILTPQSWAGAPMFMDGDAIKREFWRDGEGKPTDDQDKMELGASTRAYERKAEKYNQTVVANKPGGMPLTKRLLKPEQAFPMIVDGRMKAMFIERKVNMVELGASGWEIPVEVKDATQAMVEVVTPNRCRYYLGTKEIVHGSTGEGGLVTNTGFVPYTYQTSLAAGETEYGSYGLPILGLIDSNIRTYDTLKTYLMNAVHLASFTSFVIEYIGDERTVGSIIENRTGKTLTTFDFKTGTIMDFGPGRKVVPLTHPGLNADFWKALAAEEQEMDRIIPRTLAGEASSSGYNTAMSSVQARSLFNSIYGAEERLLTRLGKMDMHHVDSLPDPVYLEWEKPSTGRAKQFERVKLDKTLIGGYYQLKVDIDRVVDPQTEGMFRLNMMSGGVGDVEWVAEGAGIHDFEDMYARQARDRVFTSEVTKAAMDQRAVNRFKLRVAVSEAAAAGRIQMAPDGTPMVSLSDGRSAGPGLGVQTPQGQGAAGLMGGQTNNPAMQSNGGANTSSTNNPASKGGAVKGAPQRAPYRPTPQNQAA